MSDDLVKRLRVVTGFIRFETGDRVAASACLSEEAADRIEALTELLEAARAAADEAEAYAEELAGDQVDLCRQLIAAEDKLAKTVDTLMFYGGVMPNAFLPIQDGGEKARATLDDMHRENQ
jgi:hypothetical protein